MNGLITKLWFRFISLTLFSRKYYAYRDKKYNNYYIKTCKIFTVPKYIHVNKNSKIVSTKWKSKALQKCTHYDIEAAHRTITMFKQNCSMPKSLRFEEINLF